MKCLVCHSRSVVEHLDVGRHPVSTFFLSDQDAPERRFRLALGQCEECGTIQSTEIVPFDALVPPHFLEAREPEEHLDEVVDRIASLPGVSADSVIAGLSYKDDTTIERFSRMGFKQSWRVQLDEDLGISNPAANIETVQKLTTPDRMLTIANRRGLADILIVRHIIEHVEDLHAFVHGLSALVKPDGILMLEVPDCSASLQLNDYCMVWEEHSLYLTPESFAPLSTIGGFDPICTEVHPRPFENSLVQLARKTGNPGPVRISNHAKGQAGLLERYAAVYEPACQELRAMLEHVRAERGPIALFGAGHLACAFVNFMGVADLIDFVADDTPEKQYKFLPGARLPILPSAALVENGIALCLLALQINNENRVIARNKAYEEAGGTFKSIFRESPRSIFSNAP